MVEMRRESRFKMINQKRSNPGEFKHGELDLSHLKEYEQKHWLIPKLKVFLDLEVSLENLSEIEQIIKTLEANM